MQKKYPLRIDISLSNEILKKVFDNSLHLNNLTTNLLRKIVDKDKK